MLRTIQLIKDYLYRVIKLIFNRYFWLSLPYSLALLASNRAYVFITRQHDRDAFISLVNVIKKQFNYKKIGQSWQINWNGLKFELPFLSSDLLEIGCCFQDNCSKQLIKCLNIPFILEGPYITKNCYIKPNDVVLDIGSNLGIFSVFAAQVVGLNGQVWAFEPNHNCAMVIKNHKKINNFDNIKVIELALSSHTEELSFNISLDRAQGSSSILPIDSSHQVVTKVQATTLDKFVIDQQIDRLDFMKVDIEGAERLMLQGAQQTIKRFRPNIAIRIYHLPDDPEVIKGLLKSYVPEYCFETFGRKTLYAYLDKK